MSTLITQELARAQYAAFAREVEQAAAVRRAIAERATASDAEPRSHARPHARAHARLLASAHVATFFGKLGAHHRGEAAGVTM